MDASPADLRRWSEEVARDPDSPAFLPLADAYRRQGERDAALKLCLQGLGHHPMHIEAHALLARLYLEAGQREEAADAWAALLRLEPDNFAGNRGMGFYLLERGEAAEAERHLARAAAVREADPTVREALGLIRSRAAENAGSAQEQAESAEGAVDAGAGRPRGDGASASGGAGVAPGEIFEPLFAETPFRGAVVVDESGLMVAGSVREGGMAEAETIGALFSEAVAEALRMTEMLRLGDWRGMLIEAAEATAHVAPVDEGHLLVLAAAPDAPAGWIRRTASRASSLAGAFLNGGA